MEKLGQEVRFSGRIAEVRIERWRHDDGEEVVREVVGHPGAVAIVAIDDENVWLVRQPREAVGDPALLELPAGKLDIEGEPPLETAKRELAEEIGRRAERWESLSWFYTSPGFSDERVHLFLAEKLSDAGAVARHEEEERIEIVPWPLARLDDAIERCRDSKTLIGLLELRRRRA